MAARKATDSAARKATDSGKAEVQAKVDAEDDRGFAGVGVDPTPLENYTLTGVAAGKPTPETTESDEKPAAEDGS